MKKSLPILVILGVGLAAFTIYRRSSDRPEAGQPPAVPMPPAQDAEAPALVDAGAPERIVADEGTRPVAPASGGVSGRIHSRDPLLSPPYHLSWTRVGEPGAGALRSEDGSFALDPLSPGEWLLEVRSWTGDPGLPQVEVLGGPSPKHARVLAQRTMLVEPGKTLELEIWVGRDPVESAHLVGFLEGPRVDPESAYSVHLTVAEEDGGRFEARAAVDDAQAFDFGLVPPGQGGFELRVADRDAGAFEHLLVSGSVPLFAGEETVLPIEVPETTRIRFRVQGGGGETRIHWASAATAAHGGMLLYPHRTEVLVPAGRYMAIAYQPGLAADLEPVDAHGPAVEVVLRLVPASPRPVQLVDAGGDPVPGAVLRVVRVDGTDLGPQLALNTKTNDEGMFDASAFPAGKLEVEVYRRDGSVDRVDVDRDSLGDRLSLE